MSEQNFDFSVFVHPRILYTEQELGPAGTESSRATTDTNDLKTSRDFLIDFIWIGNDGGYKYGGDYSADYGASIEVNAQIADRAPFFPQGLIAAFALQNWWDCDRTHNPVLPKFDYPQAVFLWRHTLRWVYNPAQSFRLDWQKQPSQLGGIPVDLNLGVGLSGVSLRTGHRRLFGAGATIPAGPGGFGTPPQTGSIIQPNTMGNIADEPYLIESTSFAFDPRTWAAQDARFLNWLYVKVVPTQGMPWSDVPVPLALYGIHQGIARRSVFYKPPGGPILMKAGQSMVFQLENQVATRIVLVQIGLIGRVAPGYGSLY
jgi:hypothetical protein